ncbi:MAG: hypothetical protein L0220_31445, partial [Acidobacteria bacterium]|nr:hypothetical protein [Acidobacteriota bacterium]
RHPRPARRELRVESLASRQGNASTQPAGIVPFLGEPQLRIQVGLLSKCGTICQIVPLPAVREQLADRRRQIE